MRWLTCCLVAASLLLVHGAALAGQPLMTILYSANTFGTVRPCPS